MVKSDDKRALESFYNDQKKVFIKWGSSRFDCDSDTLIDVYQDAIVLLYFNIKEDKILSFETTAEAYLFGIARNLLLKRSIRAKKIQLVDEIPPDLERLDYSIYDRMESDHINHQLETAFKKLKGKCKEIIYLYYYNRFSLESIAQRLNYTNSDVVKSRKNQCMKSLRKILDTE